MRLKTPAQPLVFCFAEVSALLGAVARLYSRFNCAEKRVAASLSVYRGRYYLAVYGGFLQRQRVVEAVGRPGRCLGPAPTLYAYYAEHGRELSQNAVAELGGALGRGEC